MGNPLRLILTGGEKADISQAEALIKAIPAQAVIADKGYDSDSLGEGYRTSRRAGRDPFSPASANAAQVDWHRYKARNLVERFFNRLKQFRRLATRHDKRDCRFNAFLCLACAYIWLQ